jgi:hypothetical protein
MPWSIEPINTRSEDGREEKMQVPLNEDCDEQEDTHGKEIIKVLDTKSLTFQEIPLELRQMIYEPLLPQPRRVCLQEREGWITILGPLLETYLQIDEELEQWSKIPRINQRLAKQRDRVKSTQTPQPLW